MLSREREKLDKALGGIKDMGGLPDLIFVIDTNKERLAIQEAGRLNIPVAAIVDTNCDPDGITFPIPGNDDAGRAISALLRSDRARRDRRHFAQPGLARRRYRRDGEAGRRGAARGRDRGAGPMRSEHFELLTAPRGAPDDLAKLQGIGPQIVKKLNDAGIFHYWQIAAMTPEDADQVAAISSSAAASSATAGSPRPLAG